MKNPIPKFRNLKCGICLLMIMLTAFTRVEAEQIKSKTPNEVFMKVLELKQRVAELRENLSVTTPWPVVSIISTGITPRHVLQKSLELLDKINRLRRILKLGPITVSPYPSREITPNEVYDMVSRLVDEVAVIHPFKLSALNKISPVKGKIPADVYKELSEISRAIDPVLGIRGLKPTDVYAQSLKVLEQIRFLRASQNLSEEVKPPTLMEGKHPNHSLKAAYKLLRKISESERNLWMQPVSTPEIPKRIIAPGEVYDALQIVLAELERIKFRLGVERRFKTEKVEGVKSPDDVIYNIAWAIDLMPSFSLEKRLVQYNTESLTKTPDHVYAITDHILKELLKYRRIRGIQARPRVVQKQTSLSPRHVYQKILECFEKVARIREQVGLGKLALPKHPLREITPTEVYEIAIRLDSELGLVYNTIGMKSELAELDPDLALFTDKTPSDVFTNIWKISYLLDTVLGLEGFTPSDVFVKAKRVVDEIEIIANYVEKKFDIKMPPLKTAKQPSDVYKKTRGMIDTLEKVKYRAGLLERSRLINIEREEITPDDVINEVDVILAELVNLKVHLGISGKAQKKTKKEDKTSSHVYQQLEYAELLLSNLVGSEQKEKQKP